MGKRSDRVFKAPRNIAKRDKKLKTIFLAGSIEMGATEDWQKKATGFFVDKDFVVFNPRRDDWDSSWTQEYENPQFFQQVTWELDALDTADIIMLYFSPETKSPISLLELGLYADSGKLRVICPDGFWRKGNVEVVCNKYNIPLYDNLDDFYRSI